jgi:hypothetical protein
MMKLRAYALVNQYISGIHAGIQTGHALMELVNKYGCSGVPAERHLKQWRETDKTLILLEGGYQSRIYEEMELWEKMGNTFPYAHFCEEEDALNGALTAAVIIVPEYIFKYDVDLDCGSYYYEDDKGIQRRHRLDQASIDIAKGLRKYRLKGV